MGTYISSSQISFGYVKMRTRDKGNRIQRKLIEQMQEDGFLVSKSERGGKFNTEKDLFGLFDLVAIDYTTHKGVVHFIQVTTNRPHTHKKYQEFVDTLEPQAVVTQHVWYDRKGWKVFRYLPFENKRVVDLRK